MIQLYQYEVCPYCCKVKAVLDYKGIPYEKIEVNPMNQEELKQVEGAKTYGKVPVLVDGKKVVFESNDIIAYLDQKFPDQPVIAKNNAEQKTQKEWMKYADEELVQILPGNIYRSLPEALSSFKYITKVGKFPAWKRYMIALGGATVMTMVAKKGLKKRGITDARKALSESLEKWSHGLKGKNFMGGEKPDVSDLVVYGILNSVHELKVWDFIAQNKKVDTWYNRVTSSLN